jgi:hypothetical protein
LSSAEAAARASDLHTKENRRRMRDDDNTARRSSSRGPERRIVFTVVPEVVAVAVRFGYHLPEPVQVFPTCAMRTLKRSFSLKPAIRQQDVSL